MDSKPAGADEQARAQERSNVGKRRLLGIDWGTSNRRAYLVDGGGACLASRADDQGLLAARPHFGASLAALLAAMDIAPGVPVVASGMVGSAQGWRQTPYLDIGVPLLELPAHLTRVDEADENDDLGGRSVLLVPGYSQHERGADGHVRIDVMRGEEMQLLGALMLRTHGGDGSNGDGWYVLPGTHSKWVRLEGGAIRHIATFMTGELFATLGKQGTLAPLMEGAAGEESPESDAAFDAGVDEARRRAPLSNALFGVRARVVTGAMPAAHTRAFVSGLLIGAELVAALDLAGHDPGTVTSVCTPALHRHYARAAGRLGVTLQALDPDRVYRAALGFFLRHIDPTYQRSQP
ncbi:2-dehydro-3-deoxygalactonokinase [Massilia forsythiae]|uniref:2-dehydro-3-deoxygalactonokinase n=2 Tax=Massilia forsythiae TaxID=2728020 RepID=A0A7Z2W2L7_9BURK|nr:2-dehydro-3-deoxygalactonokinase [Massilia forsythiae]